MQHIYDLSAPISSKTVGFPGDPPFSKKELCSLEDGQKFGLCQMELVNHASTHIDFPKHTVEGGKTSSDFPIQYLMGPGLIIKVPSKEKSVTKEFVSKQSILKNDIVFFKTANSKKTKF